MLVDPNTGQPLPDLGPDGSTIAGQGMIDAAQAAGLSQEDMPLLWDVASSMPGITTTSLWNMNRVSNTMITGGRVDRPRGLIRSRAGAGRGGTLTQGARQTFSPLNFNRLTRAANIDPSIANTVPSYASTGRGGNTIYRRRRRDIYSPFNILTTGGNAAARFGSRYGPVRAMLARSMGQEYDVTTDAFSRGTFGRMAAMARVQSMSGEAIAGSKIPSSLADIGGDANPNLLRNLENIAARTPGGGTGPVRGVGGKFVGNRFANAEAQLIATRATHVGAIGSQLRGISGRVAGEFAGAQGARIAGATGVDDAVSALTRGYNPESTFARGVGRAATAYRGGEGVTRASQVFARAMGSRGAALGMRAVPYIGQALLVRDLAMMGGKLVGTVGRTMIEAGQELVAPLNTPPMGAMFRDNAVAATSRQRGVAAIANSRLNMRSVLGNEAAAMHAHFG